MLTFLLIKYCTVSTHELCSPQVMYKGWTIVTSQRKSTVDVGKL